MTLYYHSYKRMYTNLKHTKLKMHAPIQKEGKTEISRETKTTFGRRQTARSE